MDGFDTNKREHPAGDEGKETTPRSELELCNSQGSGVYREIRGDVTKCIHGNELDGLCQKCTHQYAIAISQAVESNQVKNTRRMEELERKLIIIEQREKRDKADQWEFGSQSFATMDKILTNFQLQLSTCESKVRSLENEFVQLNVLLMEKSPATGKKKLTKTGSYLRNKIAESQTR